MAVAEADVVGFAPDVEADVDPEVAVEVDDAGAFGPWKSVHVSVRNVSPLAVTLSAVGGTV